MIEAALHGIEAGAFGLVPDLRQADRPRTARGSALGHGLRRLPRQEAPLSPEASAPLGSAIHRSRIQNDPEMFSGSTHVRMLVAGDGFEPPTFGL